MQAHARRRRRPPPPRSCDRRPRRRRAGPCDRGLSRSRRAAMSAPMESGIGQLHTRPESHRAGPQRFSSRSRSSRRRTSSSAKSGLPPLRSRGNAAWRLTGRQVAPRRARMSCPVSSPESTPSATLLGGGRQSRHRGRRARAPPGRPVARSQERVRQPQVLREVVEESEHGTVGPVQVLDDEHGGSLGGLGSSRKARQAAKFSSREASSASRPRRGRRRGAHPVAIGTLRGEPPRGGPPCRPPRRSRGCRHMSARSRRGPRR